MYGHHPWLPIDIEFGVMQVNILGPTYENYAHKLKAGLKWAYVAAQEVNSQGIKLNWKFCCMALVPG